MSVRKKYDQRCHRCCMKHELCLCAELQPQSLPTKVIIITTKREAKVPTNTGRLAALSLANSITLIRGDQDQPYDLNDHLSEGRQGLLLYPGPDAEVLTPDLIREIGEPVDLVVPDGNWRQTSKMCRRDPRMAQLRAVKLAPGDATRYRVRKETKAEGLATIEAIARALGVIESKHVQEKLEELFETMVSRTLASRGLNNCDKEVRN